MTSEFLFAVFTSKYSYSGGVFLFSLQELFQNAAQIEKLGIVGIAFLIICLLIYQDSKKQKSFDIQLASQKESVEKLIAEKDALMLDRMAEKDDEIKQLKEELRELRSLLNKQR